MSRVCGREGFPQARSRGDDREQGMAGAVLRLMRAVLSREGKDLPHIEQPALPWPGVEASPQTSCHPRNPSLEACLIPDVRCHRTHLHRACPFSPAPRVRVSQPEEFPASLWDTGGSLLSRDTGWGVSLLASGGGSR